MIGWPLALICIISVVSVLIYLACTSWYWKADAQQQSQDDAQQDWEAAKTAQRHLDSYATGGYIKPMPRLPDPYPTRPSPARRPDYGSDPPTPEPIVTHNHEHQWVDITALNELPNSRYLCAVCSASRLALADCDEPTTTH